MQKNRIRKINIVAFTLIELLVVIVIIGILSSFILTFIGSAAKKANLAKGQAFSDSLRNTFASKTISQYDLNGNANDSWGGNNAVSITGATYVATGCISGGCYSFDGNDYIDLGDYDDLPSFWFDTKDWSIFVWAKPSTLTLESCLFGLRTGSDQDFRIGINSSNKAYVTWVSYPGHPAYSATTSSASMNDGYWHYIGAARNGGTITLYVDGIAVGTDATVGTYDITGSNWFSRWSIGSYRNGCCTTWEAGSWAAFFYGLIDDVRVYNKAILTYQVREQYYAGLNSLLSKGLITKEDYLSRTNELGYEY